jgi:hypothetical protein
MVFTDVEGSTVLLQELGELAYVQAYGGDMPTCSTAISDVWTAAVDGDRLIDVRSERLREPPSYITSFGEDRAGELELVSGLGDIFRLDPPSSGRAPSQAPEPSVRPQRIRASRMVSARR